MIEDFRMSLEQARNFAADVLVRADTSQENAEIVAEALVAAEADGLKGHGLSRLPSYAPQSKSGKVDGHAVPVLEQILPSVLSVNAKSGFAYPALKCGLEKLSEVAKVQGVAVLGVHHSHHCGVAGHYVEHLAREGLIALMFANAPACIAPWGGSQAVYGTNPIAFASPQKDRQPLVVDLSVSKTARGNIMRAAQSGGSIPEGWALNSDGMATTDAQAALSGTMLPMGGAKGTALALIVEIFSAILIGANASYQATSFFDAQGASPNTGQFLFALDPQQFNSDYFIHLTHLINRIEAQRGARLPGVRRYENRSIANEKGILIPSYLFQLCAKV